MKPVDNLALIKLQEVYFDICDAINNDLFMFNKNSEIPQEFDSIKDWLMEQKNKLEKIELLIKAESP